MLHYFVTDLEYQPQAPSQIKYTEELRKAGYLKKSRRKGVKIEITDKGKRYVEQLKLIPLEK